MSQASKPTTNLRRRKPATKAVVVKAHRRQAPKKAGLATPLAAPPRLSVENAIALRDHMKALSPLRIAKEQRRLRRRSVAARVLGWAIFASIAFVVISHAMAR